MSKSAASKKTHWLNAALVAMLTLLSFQTTEAASVSGQGTWETTLQGRDLDGNASNGFEAYYDTDLNITWLTNVTALSSGNLYSAIQQARQLDAYGVKGWRIPNAGDNPANHGWYTDGTSDYFYNMPDQGYDHSDARNEIGHLFYVTLGNQSAPSGPADGKGLTNTGPFANLEKVNYLWSTGFLSPKSSVVFLPATGQQSGMANNYYFPPHLNYTLHGWAVLDGDVVAVPEVNAAWLMLLGLGGVAWVARRGEKRQA